MINIRHLTIEELQRLASIGTEDAVMELGRRFIGYKCYNKECGSCNELQKMVGDLEDLVSDLYDEIEYLNKHKINK